MEKVNIFWFRRDLRLEDNIGLYRSLQENVPVLPIFIFDENILEQIDNESDARITFIHNTISNIKKELKEFNSSLRVLYGNPMDVILKLSHEFDVQSLFANKDYEPYAIHRDREIEKELERKGIKFKTFKDQVIFEEDEIIKDDGTPYTVYTPYMKKWKQKFEFEKIVVPKEPNWSNFLKTPYKDIMSLSKIGFKKSELEIPYPKLNDKTFADYEKKRDIPNLDATTHLGIYLRFGNIGIRQLILRLQNKSETFLNEIIWREFFMQILFHFPHVVKGSFRKKYDSIQWRNNEDEFKLWCEGKTGVPIVDAGMRELNNTGFMHNRVRMIVASYLVKDLLIDWRWGEAYFANKLLDFDLSSNNGNWQWAAGTGCDAAPYFRVFNPELQTKKFDPELKYIHKWIPELNSPQYPKAIVDHQLAKKRVLSAYKEALN